MGYSEIRKPQPPPSQDGQNEPSREEQPDWDTFNDILGDITPPNEPEDQNQPQDNR